MGCLKLKYHTQLGPLGVFGKNPEGHKEKSGQAQKNALDYYPFGWTMPGRQYNPGEYRYSFQGQEADDEIKGAGNSINYKYRMHDPRLGRFLSLDPLAPEYPHNSPYAFSENRVIDAVELEGLESQTYIYKWSPDMQAYSKPIKITSAATIGMNLGTHHIFKGGPDIPAGFNARKIIIPGKHSLSSTKMDFFTNVKSDREIGEEMELVGDVIEFGGIVLSAIPHPVARRVGAVLISGGDAMSKAGVAIQITEDIKEGDSETAYTRGGIELASGFLGSLINKGMRHAPDNTPILNDATNVVGQGVLKVGEEAVEEELTGGE